MLKWYFQNIGAQHYHFLLRRWWPAAAGGVAGQRRGAGSAQERRRRWPAAGRGSGAWSWRCAGAAAAVAGGDGAQERRGGCRWRRRRAGRPQRRVQAAARSPMAAGAREGMGNGRVRVGLGRSNECRLLHESQIVEGGEEKKSSEGYIELAVESSSTTGRVLLLEREEKTLREDATRSWAITISPARNLAIFSFLYLKKIKISKIYVHFENFRNNTPVANPRGDMTCL